MEGWQQALFADVIQSSGTIDPTKAPSDTFEYVDVSSVNSQTLQIEETTTLLGKDAPSRARRLIKSGDVIFATIRPTLKRIAVVPDELDGQVCSTGYFVFRPKPTMNNRFLFYFLQTDTFIAQMEKLQTGASYPAVNDTQVKQQQILFPPLPEQKRIVALLDEAFEGIDKAIANTEKNLANARELFDSTVQAVFGGAEPNWQTVTLQYLLDNNWILGHLDGNHGSDYPRKEEFVASGVPYISANCIDGEQVFLDRAKYLSPERASRIRKGVACDGDVLFAHNATVGPVAMLRTTEPKVILGTSLTYYRCNPDHIISEYLAHYMRSPIFCRQYELVMGQSTRNQVPITKQREFTHVVPPLSVQGEIATRLDGLDDERRRLEGAYEAKVQRLAELKQVLLGRAFAGQLSPTQELTEAAE